jgi:regulator of protease activity HflC (stomatin/prohibitin superfamily)
MTWIVLSVLLGLVVVVCLVVAQRLGAAAERLRVATAGESAVQERVDPASNRASRRRFLLGAASGFTLWLLLTVFFSVHQIDAGHVGVVYTFGNITDQTDSGLQFTAPWQTVKDANVQVQRYTFAGDEDIDAFSAESQDVFIVATLNYQVSPNAIQELYRNVGTNWFDRLVLSRVLQFVKDETVRYETVEIAPNRETIRVAVRDRLRAELAPYSVSVVDFLVDNIEFPQAFKDAITAKQVAEQEALRAEEEIREREAEAEQRRVEAQGIADANVIQAEGQAAANELLAESLTAEVLQYQAIQNLGDNIEIALIPSGEGIIIDPAGLLGTLTERP